jgi:hypothetical protein
VGVELCALGGFDLTQGLLLLHAVALVVKMDAVVSRVPWTV